MKTDGAGLDRTLGALVLLALGLLLWRASSVVMLVCAAILLAVVLDGASRRLASRLHLPRALLMVSIVLAFCGLTVLLGLAVFPRLAQQLDQLADQLAGIYRQLQELVGRYRWLKQLLDDNGQEGGPSVGSPSEMAGQLAQASRAVLDVLSSAVLIGVIGLFLAANPELYRQGLLRLIPPRRRPLARRLFSQVARALRWWMMGQMVSMTVLGVLTSGFLWLLDVELWLPLGVITALCTFIPFLGPILAAIPVILISLAHGLSTAIYVTLFYTALQSFEGYWLTPMVQQRAVRLPPALLITMQVLLGMLLGLPGLALAAPLTAAGMVVVQQLWTSRLNGSAEQRTAAEP